MTLNILVGGSGAAPSNKPQKDLPDGNLCKDEIKFPDGRTVWRSNVRPDRISFVSYLAANQFAFPKGHNKTLTDVFSSLLGGLSGAVEGEVGGKAFVPSSGTRGTFTLPCGPRGAIIYLALKREKVPGTVVPAFSVRVEFNPRKLQPSGIHQFLEILEQCFDVPIDVGAFLSNATVTRYDAAVDFVGLCPSELVATIEKPGKRLAYFGGDGLLETVQLHKKRATPSKPLQTIKNPLGVLGVKIYDRTRERAAHGKPAPVPGYAVTRAEVVKTRLGAGFSFADLLVAEPFKDVRLSYAATAAPLIEPSVWNLYLAVKASVGDERATILLGLSGAEAKALKKAFQDHPNTLLSSLSSAAWQAGIAETGLDQMIALSLAK